jgi:hypothetical protein
MAFMYENAGDAPQTDHKLKGGDEVRLVWAGFRAAADGTQYVIDGRLKCTV